MNELLVTIFADGAVIPIVLIGAWALLFKVPMNDRYRAYCRVLMAGLTSYALAKLVAGVYQPELQRPFELMGLEAGASYLNNPGFPSDHVLFCAAITFAVWFETRHKTATIILIILTLLVGVGRIAALVHSPLDVLGGLLFASIGALWYLQRETPSRPGIVKQWSKPKKAGKIL
ncbi:phosphatase PAP2 family protein [Candidatus Saccharibacteria bacterium]|nr:phosphatase PAP2 family protein [Candidatus Saccharibacteria bacterium]